MFSKLFKSKLILQIFLACAITILATAAIVSASTTIGTNIYTGGSITAIGNVGIGTTSPTALLDVTGTNSTATAGSEMIVATADRDFSSDTGKWTGTGWTVGSNVITHTAGANAMTLDNAALTSTPASSNIYQITFTTNTTVAGTITPSIGGVSGIAVGQATGADTQTQIITATGSGALTFTPDANWTGTIDNVSVIKIIPSSATQIIRNSDGSIGSELRSGIGGFNLPNTFIGIDAGKANTTGYWNTAVGSGALASNTTGTYNTANGYRSLANNTTGGANTASGFYSLLSNITGGTNTASGYRALSRNTIGSQNTATGYQSLAYNTTGWYNTANGYAALIANTTGSSNVADGYYSLVNNTTGSYNIALGSGAGSNLTTGSNNIIIGYNVNAPSATASQQLNIGNLIYGTGVYNGGSISATPTSGNVGIGTTSPLAKLAIKGSSNSTGRLLQITDSGDVEKITILDNGNVGIGTVSPTSKLQIVGSDTTEYSATSQGSSASDLLEIWNTNTSATNNFAAIRFVTRNSLVSIGRISLIPYGYTSSAFTFQLRNGDAVTPEIMRIASNGKVGIATSTPATTLDVNGLIRVYQTASTTCAAAIEGSIFYNSDNKHFWGCDGTNWNRLDN